MLGLIFLQRARQVAAGAQHVADVLMREAEVALPIRVAGIGGGEPDGDRQADPVLFERPSEVALRRQHGAQAGVDDAQVLLRGNIRADHALGRGAAGAVARQRLAELVLQRQHVADLEMQRHQAALSAGIMRGTGEEPLGEHAAGAIACQCGVELALCAQHVAELLVRRQQVAVRTGIVLIERRQALADGEGRVVARQRVVERTVGGLNVAGLEVAQHEVALAIDVVYIGHEAVRDGAAGAVFGERLLQLTLHPQRVTQRVVEVAPAGEVGRGVGGGPLQQSLRLGRAGTVQVGVAMGRVPIRAR
jgi:hypothetical protein